ncbi:MAG: glycogen synthase GlgA [Prochlorotrichaceae cyanobacterium]
MKILFIAAEAAPLAKIGGMGDVVGTLPRILKKMGHDVRIMMPYYGFLSDKVEVPKAPIWSASVMFQTVTVHQCSFPQTEIPLYLLGNWSFSSPKVADVYAEGDDWRFTLFANGATKFIQNYWKPDVVHCHDWHTGMIPVWLKDEPGVATVFTIHNLAYQGPWRDRLEEITTVPPDMRGHNTLAAALLYADQVNAVSPTYAQQIQTSEYGEQVEDILISINHKLHGILNGIDMDQYNPGVDSTLPQNYTLQTLPQRERNKAELQKQVGLELEPKSFMVGMVSRLVEQKGIDLLIPIVDRFLEVPHTQLVILGTGEKPYEAEIQALADRFPEQLSAQLLYSDALSRRIYAGTDAFLMPSRFEPCGISQMLALRYGSVPVVRHTGGLVDTVSDHEPQAGTGNGYAFESYDPYACLGCLMRAREGFQYSQPWQALQQRGMGIDFSWDRSAEAYVDLYQQAIVSKRKQLQQKPSPVAAVSAVL